MAFWRGLSLDKKLQRAVKSKNRHSSSENVADFRYYLCAGTCTEMWMHTELCLASTQLDWLEQEENLKSFWKNIRHLLGLDTDFGYVLFGQHALTWKLSGRLCKSECSPESLTNLKLGFLKWFFRSPAISLNLCPQNPFSQHRDQRKSLWRPVLLSSLFIPCLL